MLTKDLLRYRRRGEKVMPSFVDVACPELLELAERLLLVYSGSPGATREALEEQSGPLLRRARDLTMAKGLDKLLLDRCEFTAPADFDYAACRAELFAASAAALKAPEALTLAEHRSRVLAAAPALEAFAAKGLYCDLPDCERLVKFKELSAPRLLERYNVALAQSLLFYSGGLDVEAEEPNPAEARKLFKYLKFFRLLACVKAAAPAGRGKFPSKFHIHVDGPMSVFENTRMYGLRLACFFPAVCALPKWRLRAVVKLQNRELLLDLDQGSNLVGHYHNFSAYVPEEFAMFHKHFKEKSPDWRIVGDSPFLDFGDQELVFPDLSFKSPDGTVVHLELFHRWHAGQLSRRLASLERKPGLPLIVGVDKYLYEKPELRLLLDSSGFFASSGYVFRDFPGVDKTRACLARKLEALGKA